MRLAVCVSALLLRGVRWPAVVSHDGRKAYSHSAACARPRSSLHRAGLSGSVARSRGRPPCGHPESSPQQRCHLPAHTAACSGCSIVCRLTRAIAASRHAAVRGACGVGVEAVTGSVEPGSCRHAVLKAEARGRSEEGRTTSAVDAHSVQGREGGSSAHSTRAATRGLARLDECLLSCVHGVHACTCTTFDVHVEHSCNG